MLRVATGRAILALKNNRNNVYTNIIHWQGNHCNSVSKDPIKITSRKYDNTDCRTVANNNYDSVTHSQKLSSKRLIS